LHYGGVTAISWLYWNCANFDTEWTKLW